MADPERPKDDDRAPPARPTFERKPMQWGRMPQATFQVPATPADPAQPQAPAPRQAFSQFQPQASVSPQAAPRPQPRPQPRPGAGIFGGSLIPQAPRATASLDLAPRPAAAQGQSQSQTPPAPLPPVQTPTDLSVRPLPAAPPSAVFNTASPDTDWLTQAAAGHALPDEALFEPQPETPPQPETVVRTAPLVEAGAPAPVAPLPLMEQATPVEPVRDDVVLNDIHVVAARDRARRPSRLPWILGGSLIVLAVAVVGAVWMIASRPAPAPPVQTAPPVTAVVPALPSEPAPSPTPLQTLDAAAPEALAPATPAVTQPTSTQPAPTLRPALPPTTATAAPVQPVPTPEPTPSAAETPPPVVVVTPPPTAARPPQTDPDAPVVTRPQPLD